MTLRSRHRRSGFTMVMTLALIALSAALLARLANRGLALVLEERTRSEQLQAKWSSMSCRLAFLEDAERILGDSDAAAEAASAGWPFPGELQGEFQVGGIPYQFLLADEQAKFNLNTAYKEQPLKLGAMFTEVERASSAHVPLRPNAAFPLMMGSPVADDENGQVFTSWGQIVDLERLGKSPAGGKGLIEFARYFTYSSRERLNVRRASDEALRQTARLVLTHSEAEELVEVRRGYSGELREWLRSLSIPSRRLVRLRRLLGDRSHSYSLWLWNEQEKHLTLATVGQTRGDSQGQVLEWP